MVQSITRSVFKRPDESYLEWLFPQNKKSLVTGLIFTFITVTAISIVDVFYYSDLFSYASREAAIAAGGKTFEFDNFYRLIFAPLFNTIIIFIAYSSWNNSMKSQKIIVATVLFVNISSFLCTGIYNDYYTAAKDFTYEALIMILFAQTLYGLTFRVSFGFNLLIVLTTVSYLFLDDDLLNEFLYSLTILLLIWIPVVVGTFKLEKSRLSNFKTISELKEANKKIAQQKNLMKTGEGVSKIGSWNFSRGLTNIEYSAGIFDIYEIPKKEWVDEELNLKMKEMIHKEDLPLVMEEVENLIKGTASPFYEYRILLPNQKMKWLKCTIGEYIEGEGYYGTIQDVTSAKLLELELQKTARELQEKNEDLKQFAYASSHDLQEPLRSITNFVSILDKKLGDNLSKEHKFYMDIVLSSAGRMKNLINAILDYSRLGKNKKLEKFDTNEVLQDVITDLSFSIENAQAIIEIANLPEVSGYRTEFSILMQNLLGNALKFRKKGVQPVIQIMGMELPDYYQFYIQDNGIGMNAKYSKRIFQLFSRLHSKEEYEGTGIGLTHSKKIVELHGGTIWVDSTPNKGTTFHFTISKKLNCHIHEKETELHLVN